MTLIAEAASRWWADHLREGFTPDNGDAMSTVVAVVAGIGRSESNADRVDSFQSILETAIDQQLTRLGSVYLTVDYGPEGILHDALAESSVRSQLPWKTSMVIHPGTIEVSQGYGAPMTRIFEGGAQ